MVLVLRRTQPDLKRPFRAPLVGIVAPLSVVCCLGLMSSLAVETWIRFLVWLALGFVVYFTYGMRHSRVGRGETASSKR